MPVQLAIDFLASGAIAVAVQLAPRLRFPVVDVTTAAVTVLGAHAVFKCEAVRRDFERNSSYVEADRSQAGIWVAGHTPPHFRVMTGFGCPSYYCDRFVFDYSGLNMTGEVGQDHLISTFRPEVLILCPFRTGVSPQEYQPPAGYDLVACFDSSRTSGHSDFYAVVLVRNDVVSRLTK